MTDPSCPTCGHPVTQSRCWRLTCPTNGARESFEVVDRPIIEPDYPVAAQGLDDLLLPIERMSKDEARRRFPSEQEPGYGRARRASAEAGRRVRTNRPSTWGEPPEPEFML